MTADRNAVADPAVGTGEPCAYLSPLADFLVVLSVTLSVAIGGVLLLVP